MTEAPRTKMTPSDVVAKGGNDLAGIFKNKWVMYSLLGVGGAGLVYFLLTNNAAGAPQQNTGTAGILTAGSPIGYYGTGGATPASVGGSTGDSSSNDALAAAINGATQQNSANLAAAQQALTNEANVAIANDTTQLNETALATQASNYAASAAVVQSLTKVLPAGTIGFAGSVNPTATGGLNVGFISNNQKNPLDFSKMPAGSDLRIGTIPNSGVQTTTNATFPLYTLPGQQPPPPTPPTVH